MVDITSYKHNLSSKKNAFLFPIDYKTENESEEEKLE